MNPYHAHIYFKTSSKIEASALEAKIQSNKIFKFVKIHNSPVGPHHTPMIEAHFNDNNYSQVVSWLEENRGDFSVLIHPDTGDDHKDHTIGIKWLGPMLPIHFEFFDKILEDPRLRIHPLE